MREYTTIKEAIKAEITLQCVPQRLIAESTGKTQQSLSRMLSDGCGMRVANADLILSDLGIKLVCERRIDDGE